MTQSTISPNFIFLVKILRYTMINFACGWINSTACSSSNQCYDMVALLWCPKLLSMFLPTISSYFDMSAASHFVILLTCKSDNK